MSVRAYRSIVEVKLRYKCNRQVLSYYNSFLQIVAIKFLYISLRINDRGTLWASLSQF